jgi:hypothetical protein
MEVVGGTLRQGEPFRFRLRFRNDGEDAFYFERTFDVGQGAVMFMAQRDNCTYESEPQHFDMDLASRRFLFMPLMKDDTFDEREFVLNDPRSWGGPALVLPTIGIYHLWAVFTSQGSPVAGPLWPVWRGSAQTREIQTTVEGPDARTVAEWRSRLKSCLNESCHDFSAIEYFRLVRDGEAAELLAALLKRHSGNRWLVGAVVRQGRAQDASLLEAEAEVTTLGQGWRSVLLEGAKQLRGESACGAAAPR